MAADTEFDAGASEMQALAGEDMLRALVRTLVQESMEEEVAVHLGAKRHVRTPERRVCRLSWL